MTVQNTSIRKAGPTQGNGLNVAFPFSFKVFATTEVVVTFTNAVGIESILALGTDYSVLLNSDQNAVPGGTVNMLVAPAVGTFLTITSNVSNTQNLALTGAGGFYPQSINDALDRVVILIQQLAEQVSRSVKTTVSSSISPDSLVASVISSAASALNSANNAANSATLASQVLADTSTTTNTIGTGSKTFNISLGKNFRAGQYVIIADALAPTSNYMNCQIVSYSTITGVLVVTSISTLGSGTKTSWIIGISGPAGSSVNWKGAYSGTTTYNINDAVTDGYNSFICIAQTTGNAPPNSTYWSVLSLQGATGATGVTGAKGVNWKGVWSAVTAYVVGDAVSSGGSSYICLAAHTNFVPPNVAYWDTLAQQGVSGAGTGDVIGGTAASTGELVLYSSTTGKAIGRSNTLSGIIKAASGVATVAVANTDYLPVANPVASGSMTVPLVQHSQGADIASAATTNLETATGNYVQVTGTTAITALTLNQGHIRLVKFTAALTLTNGASLVLPGGANITTGAGDCAVFVGEAAGVVRCLAYTKASGNPVVGSFPTGTRLGFQQTAAPTGWTKDVTAALNDSIMRIVTGTVASGGSLAFSTWAAQTTDGATTLTTAQIPAHTHSDYYQSASVTGSSTAYAYPGGKAPPLGVVTAIGNTGFSTTSGSQGGGGSHTHSLSQNLKYYDFIIASAN